MRDSKKQNCFNHYQTKQLYGLKLIVSFTFSSCLFENSDPNFLEIENECVFLVVIETGD